MREIPPTLFAMKRNGGDASWIYRKVLDHPLLRRFLEMHHESWSETVHVGWGYRPSGRAAMRAAMRDQSGKLLLIEDAFVRSLQTGGQTTIYGLLADGVGMHYDANRPSDLLDFLESGKSSGWMSDVQFAPNVVDTWIQRFRSIGASKYNWFADEFKEIALPVKSGILVVDQTRGDMAIRHAGLREADFGKMLRHALDLEADSPVYLRGHPDHVFRSKRGCFPKSLLRDSRIHYISPNLSPAQCFSFCHTVVVGSSLLGMEALIHGCKVVTYGTPFYAGWGVTEDHSPHLRRSSASSKSVRALFEAAYLRYCHYFDPDTGEPCDFGTILDHLELQKESFRHNRGSWVSIGFSPWKRTIVEQYLRSPSGGVSHASDFPKVADDLCENQASRCLLWGRKQDVPTRFSGKVTRVEDGFLRSKGLGAAFNFPYSWVLDETGIYFDPTQPSDLENLYNTGFQEADLATASALIELLRAMRITKYNLEAVGLSMNRVDAGGRKIILVPGQVEQDASILFGSPIVKTNLQLLQTVRAAEPEAFLIYKPHPDLMANVRHGNALPHGLEQVADRIVTDGSVLDWLELCDEVHTMTSTVGFEALIRGVAVVTYGMPFYAGWGLTTDRMRCERRQRRLTLEDLVCGALVKYPRYLNPKTGEFTTALKAARLLVSGDVAGDRRAMHLKVVSKLKQLWVKSANLAKSS